MKTTYESPQMTEFSFSNEGIICTSIQALNAMDALQEMEVESFEW